MTLDREWAATLRMFRKELWAAADQFVANERNALLALYYAGRFDATLANFEAFENILYDSGEIDILEARAISLPSSVGRGRCQS